MSGGGRARPTIKCRDCPQSRSRFLAVLPAACTSLATSAIAPTSGYEQSTSPRKHDGPQPPRMMIRRRPSRPNQSREREHAQKLRNHYKCLFELDHSEKVARGSTRGCTSSEPSALRNGTTTSSLSSAAPNAIPAPPDRDRIPSDRVWLPRGAIGAEEIAVANMLDHLLELEPRRMAPTRRNEGASPPGDDHGFPASRGATASAMKSGRSAGARLGACCPANSR